MRLTERDELILREVDRWRACGSKHIRLLANFSGQRATDRRLKMIGLPITQELLSELNILKNLTSLRSKVFLNPLVNYS